MTSRIVGRHGIPVRNIHVRIRVHRGTLHLGLHEQAFELSEVAGLIWRFVDGKADILSIARRVAAEYGIPEDVAMADTMEMVEGWQADSLIALLEDGSGGSPLVNPSPRS
ncbi:PqqD family protein [Streptomyces mirabilis]|uniref:PqqD family protein n=1 Tax=Streptomyces mirabilis TaxID=68239 RepID=UPI00382B9F59